MLLHKRLQNALNRAGLSSDVAPADVPRLLVALSDAFAQLDAELLQSGKIHASSRRELQTLFDELVLEHEKLGALLAVVTQPLAALSADGEVLCSSAALDRIWPPESQADRLRSLLPLASHFVPNSPQPARLRLEEQPFLLHPWWRHGALAGALLVGGAPRASLGEVRVLVVSSDPDVRALLQERARRAGCACQVADNGLQAWELYGQQPFHLLFSDWSLPDMTGAELCDLVRERGSAWLYPVLVLLADNAEAADAAVETQADDVLLRPLAAPEIDRRLRSVARMAAFGTT